MEINIDLAPIKKNIDKAKLRLMLDNKTTFFSSLLANLYIVLDNRHKTACTNGIYLQMNPNWIKDFDKDTLLGLILHELMHVVFDHCNGRIYKDLDHNILGIAMDHYINLYITSLGYIIPKDGYCDYKYKGLSTMQIYHILVKNPPPAANEFNPDVFGCPEDMDPQDYDEVVTSNIIKAVMQAQMNDDHGSIPGDVLQKVEEATNPKLPWQVILAPYMDSYAKTEYSFRRPNRRFMPNFYLPTLQGEKLKQMTAGIDVSGSMTAKDVSEIWSEVKYIWETSQPELLRLQTFDTRVHLNKI